MAGTGASMPGGAPSGGVLPMVVAGFVCVLVGFASSYAIVVQAGRAMGLDAAQLATMTAALALGMGLTTLLPSLWLRIPVVTAWSTPGAALLAVSLPGVPLPAGLPDASAVELSFPNRLEVIDTVLGA